MSRIIQIDENGAYFVIGLHKVYRFSKHFTVSELLITNKKQYQKLNYDSLNLYNLINLFHLANVLEHIRHLLGDTVLKVNSAYRCPALNTAVGGVFNSKHISGLAADIAVNPSPHMDELLNKLLKDGYISQFIPYHNKHFYHITIPDNNFNEQ